MPTIPEESNRPSQEELVVDLLKSIAMEETAIAHLMNAGAEEIQAFVGKHLNFPTMPSNLEIISFNQSMNQSLDGIIMQEWLLLRKMERILQLILMQSSDREE